MKPDRSTETSVPSSSRTPRPPSALQSSTSLREIRSEGRHVSYFPIWLLKRSSRHDYCEVSARRGRELLKVSLRRMTSIVLVGAALAVPGVASAHGWRDRTPRQATQRGADGRRRRQRRRVGRRDRERRQPSVRPSGTRPSSFLRHRDRPLRRRRRAGPDPRHARPRLTVFFDDDHDGEKEQGEDAWIASVGRRPGRTSSGDCRTQPTQRSHFTTRRRRHGRDHRRRRRSRPNGDVILRVQASASAAPMTRTTSAPRWAPLGSTSSISARISLSGRLRQPRAPGADLFDPSL